MDLNENSYALKSVTTDSIRLLFIYIYLILAVLYSE